MTDVAETVENVQSKEQAAREPVRKPEEDKAVKHAEPAAVPSAPSAAAPTTAPSSATTGEIIVLESVRGKAEQNLTQYLAPKLIEALKAKGASQTSIDALIGDMKVGLHGELAKGKTDLKLDITGKEVANNAALIGDVFVAALKQHPQFAEFFRHEPHPHAQPGAEGSVEIHIPQLETAVYATHLQALASGAAPVTMPAAEAKIELPSEAATQETKKDTPTEAVQPATKDTPVTKDTPSPVQHLAVASNDNQTPAPQVKDVKHQDMLQASAPAVAH